MRYFGKPAIPRSQVRFAVFASIATLWALTLPLWLILQAISLGTFRGIELWNDVGQSLANRIDK